MYVAIAVISILAVSIIAALWHNILMTDGGTPWQLRRQAWESCPGHETTPNRCRCGCEGCRHHCSAHYNWTMYVL